jgi:hypothetical protein
VTTPTQLHVDWSRFETIDDAYGWTSQGATPAENIARMRACIQHDMKRRRELRAELLARQRAAANGAHALDDAETGASPDDGGAE